MAKPSRVTLRDNVAGEQNFPAAGAVDIFNDAESQAEQQYGEDIAKWYSGNVENVEDHASFATAVTAIGATVTTLLIPSVQTADNITLTRVVSGGTVGHLSVGTITAGTSFVINSSSGSDTSTIFWEIVH